MKGLGRALVAVLFLSLVAGCSTMRPTPPKNLGLLDRLNGKVIARAQTQTQNWSWPLQSVEVTSGFGARASSFHEGVDLRAKMGTLVAAAHPGIVLYAGSGISGYGKLIVLRHQGLGLSTVYAHNSKLFVKKGQRVKQGQRLAATGKSGHATGPHLHFEVRQGAQPLDPSRVMPLPQSAARKIASSK